MLTSRRSTSTSARIDCKTKNTQVRFARRDTCRARCVWRNRQSLTFACETHGQLLIAEPVEEAERVPCGRSRECVSEALQLVVPATTHSRSSKRFTLQGTVVGCST